MGSHIEDDELWKCESCSKRHHMEFRFCPFCGGQKQTGTLASKCSKPKLIGYKQREDARNSDTSSEDRTEDEGDSQSTRKGRMKRRKPRPARNMRSRSRNRQRRAVRD